MPLNNNKYERIELYTQASNNVPLLLQIQDLLSTLSRRHDDLSVFDPRSAIFVCNKWDQVPVKEADLVREDTRGMLKHCWPGIQDSQVFYMSVAKVRGSG